ncbi:MAG: nucleoside hydrolase, partial [Halieaceae bacterium]|nr:nucleoside hydrolase [Halieaceae bacterium]
MRFLRSSRLTFALFICGMLATGSVSARPVIYDTDMAIDDWLGLLYLLAEPDIEVVAVTVSASGESHCQPGLDNARNLMALAGQFGTPVACGDAYPLDGYFVFPEPWQVDSDTLSGIDIGQWVDEPVTDSPSDGHAMDLIHQVIADSEEPVAIVAVGPMTNIAEWLNRYP